MSIPGFDLYKGVPFDQINGKSNYLYINGDEIGVYRAGASNKARNPERATLETLRNKVEELCGESRSDLELRSLAAFINRKIVAYNQSGLGIKMLREVQIPWATVSRSSHPKWEGPALVVGVWQPGVPEKVVTVALDPHDLETCRKHMAEPRYPDFEGDIMQIPIEKLGPKKYTKIVFQGCCPVATAMGAKPCSSESGCYPKVDSKQLAEKLKKLILERGGFIFFRHCIESARADGIQDSFQRQRFIQSFQDVGMELITPEGLNSSCLGQYAPDSAIPDPHPQKSHKWDFDKGGMIFYMPPEENI